MKTNVWEPVAQPNSLTPPDALQPGALVVTRALGDGRLAFLEVLGEDVQVESCTATATAFVPTSWCWTAAPPCSRCRRSTLSPRLKAGLRVTPRVPRRRKTSRCRTDLEALNDPEVIEIMRTLEDTAVSDITEGLESSSASRSRMPKRQARPTDGPASGVTIEVASGLGTSRTVAPIATLSPQRQMNEVLDRELILFAKARIVAEWINAISRPPSSRHSMTPRCARASMSRKTQCCSTSSGRFHSRRCPCGGDQLFTTDAVLKTLLKAPTDIAGLWPIFDLLHHYGVVLLPPDPQNPLGRPSVMASITRVEARLDRARFDTETAAVEKHAVKFKKAVANKSILHHAIEPEAIPAEWSAGKKDQTLQVAKPVVALLRRLRALNQTWRAGTYPGHWWNDFSVDIFVAAGLETSGFWKRDSMRAFFRALNTACEQDTTPGPLRMERALQRRRAGARDGRPLRRWPRALWRGGSWARAADARASRRAAADRPV